MNWWVDGIANGALAPDDRGLQYGDGVFETVAVQGGKPLRLQRHLARMRDGLDRLGIGFDDWEKLDAEARAACAGREQAVLKLTVTRGRGGRGYRPCALGAPTRIVSVGEWAAYPAEWGDSGVVVRVCDLRLSPQPLLAGIKHLNRLEQILARAEWQDSTQWQEGLMLDTHGDVMEATQANVFAVSGGRLLTPALTECGVAGIIRDVILEDAAPALDIEASVEAVSLERLMDCEEVFLCNSLILIWPVRGIGDHRLGEPGPVTRRMREWLERHDD